MKKKDKVFFVIFVLISVAYFIFRCFFSLSPKFNIDFIVGFLVLLLEMVDNFFYDFSFFNVIFHRNYMIKTPKNNIKNYPDVDVLIATINEEEELLSNTIKHVKNMKYPGKIHIYLCDDGRRDNIKKLASKMHIEYITRNNNKDAKAGNYNNALSLTKSPYVAVFDADMCPKEEFLMKTMPFFFEEENVGFVQTPQCFSNLDIFQKRFGMQKVIPYEQYYFYNRIQLYKTRVNSAIVCGTNVVFLREALVKNGGFATKSVTEDIATGLSIQSLGYKGIAINDELAFGLNVNEYDSYLKQRSRWCTGAFQAFKFYYLPRKDKLSLRQRIEYISCFYYWTYGIRTLIYFLIPFLFILFRIKIVYSNLLVFILLLILQYIFKRAIIINYENRKVSFMWNRIYETILFPSIFIDIFKLIFKFKRVKFFVSPKNSKDKSITPRVVYTIVVHLILFAITFGGVLISVYRGINYEIEPYILSITWLSINLVYLLYALIFDFCFVKEDYDSLNLKKFPRFTWINIFINHIKGQFKYFVILLVFILSISIYPIVSIINFSNDTFETHNMVSDNGWLSINEDGQLINESGKVVSLRGVSTHNIYWFGKDYTHDNLKTLKETWGVNVFRVAMYLDFLQNGYLVNKGIKDDVIRLVDEAIKLDMYAIIDWHLLSEKNPLLVEDEAQEFFDELSLRYKDSPNVIYEICNEPNGDDSTWDDVIKPYAQRMISTIRKNSPKSVIIVGTALWSKDMLSVSNNPLTEKNVMYALHIYQGRDYNASSYNLQIALDNKLPIIVSECGVTDGSGEGDVYYEGFYDLIDELEKNKISYVVWQLSSKDESSSILQRKDIKEKYLIDKEIYSKTNLKYLKLDLNDYLSETGIVYKNIFMKYSRN